MGRKGEVGGEKGKRKARGKGRRPGREGEREEGRERGREGGREEGRKGGWMSSEGFGHCNIMRKYQNSRHIIKKNSVLWSTFYILCSMESCEKSKMLQEAVASLCFLIILELRQNKGLQSSLVGTTKFISTHSGSVLVSGFQLNDTKVFRLIIFMTRFFTCH